MVEGENDVMQKVDIILAGDAATLRNLTASDLSSYPDRVDGAAVVGAGVSAVDFA